MIAPTIRMERIKTTTVLCGTDFSEHAERAARVAAAIAKRLDLDLVLVHALGVPGSDLGMPQPLDVGPWRARLHAEAKAIAATDGVRVAPMIELGDADETLVDLASRRRARLVVVGSLGTRKQGRWLLGSVAERVAQSSSAPVLVVRGGDGLEAWARGERTLRVMVGVERTPQSLAALAWTRALREIGPCEIVVAEIVWPADEHRRTNTPPPIPLDQLRPELEQQLLVELRAWAGDAATEGGTSFLVAPGWGRVDSHLTQLAAKLDVDLLVVGTHQRAGIARLWQGSVSRGTLHGAAMSVACVPRQTESTPGQ